MENKDFAIFILSHGRPDNVRTLRALTNNGYTGRIFIVVDNEDKRSDEYFNLYGDKVVMFDKLAMANKTDEGDNFNDRRTTTHVRNAIFEIAKELNITYFMMLDDDYTNFSYRVDTDFKYRQRSMRRMDKILDIMLNYYKSVPTLLSLCMSQGGDFIGGANSAMLANGMKPRRKAMNSFICSTERPFMFFGRLNEDVDTYVSLGSRGALFLTVPNVCVNQLETQQNTGGMTDTYLDSGTYVKSFYTVMYQPSSVKIGLMGDSHKRIHHTIKWINTVPVLLDQKYKKTVTTE